MIDQNKIQNAAIDYAFEELDVGIDGIFDDLEWKLFVEFNRIDKWCYIEDILPKGGDK